MEEKILLDDNMSQYEEFKREYSKRPSKWLKYMQSGVEYKQEFIINNDTCVRYYKAIYSLKFSFNGTPFLTKKNCHCLKFDKKSNKLSLFNFDGIKNYPRLISFINQVLKVEWFDKMFTSESYSGINKQIFFNKTILEKIWSKKITNPKDLLIFYCKRMLSVKNISWNIIRQWLQLGGQHYMINRTRLIKIIDTWVNNPNLFITKIVTLEKNGELTNMFLEDVNDYLFQLIATQTHSNIAYWSMKRFTEEHSKLTAKIMEDELAEKNKELLYSDEYNQYLPKNINCSFINSEYKCFQEGNFMHHCLYTNYWGNIKALRYIAISVNDEYYGRATVGIWFNLSKQDFRLDQIRGIRNSQCNNELIEIMKKWINDNQEILLEMTKNKSLFTTTSSNNNFLVNGEFPF